MGVTIQARLDDQTAEALSRLRRLGWSPSKVVREGIRILAAMHGPPQTRIIGLGRFSSGIPDLGSNKRHLKGLGR